MNKSGPDTLKNPGKIRKKALAFSYGLQYNEGVKKERRLRT